MVKRLGFLAMLGLVGFAAPAQGQGYGFPGAGYGDSGYGFGGSAVPFASLPYPSPGYAGTFYSGPGLFNPLFGLGLSPLGVQSALGEASLRRPAAVAPIMMSSPTIVTVPAGVSRTYTYRVYRQ